MIGGKCLKCGGTEFWTTKDGRLKCKKCRYLFKPRINPFNIPTEKLREIISEFLLEHSIESISLKVQISKYKLIKILTTLRKLMSLDIPEEIKKVLKINLNPEKELKIKGRPIIGVFSYKEWVFAKVLTEIKPRDLKIFMENKKNEPMNSGQKNLGIIYKKNLYKLTEEKNTLYYFWEYLREKLNSRGGIRREKIPLFLAEYVWRFNYRNKNFEEKEERLFNLLSDYFFKT
jgi:uncharacterized Zn finger protein (UPF0148 family)